MQWSYFKRIPAPICADGIKHPMSDVLYIYIDQYHVNVMIVSAMQRKTDATNDNAGSVLLPLPPWDEMKGVADVLWSDSGFHSPLNLNYHIHQRLSWNTCQRWSVSWPPTFHPASAVGSPHLCKSLPVQPWVYNKQKPSKPSCTRGFWGQLVKESCAEMMANYPNFQNRLWAQLSPSRASETLCSSSHIISEPKRPRPWKRVFWRMFFECCEKARRPLKTSEAMTFCILYPHTTRHILRNSSKYSILNFKIFQEKNSKFSSNDLCESEVPSRQPIIAHGGEA